MQIVSCGDNLQENCQNLFSRKNKKNVMTLLSAEAAKRVVKVKIVNVFACLSVLAINEIYFPPKGKRSTICRSQSHDEIHIISNLTIKK